MAITESIGYGGTVSEDAIAGWRRSFPSTYGVVGAGDWAVSLKTGVDRTVGIAAGDGFGHGVVDTNDAEVTVQLTTLASGTRYDLIVAHRDWSGAGGTTTFTYVTGTSSETAAFAARDQTPGDEDDQPIALVQVTGNGGGGVIAAIRDLRVWAANGGASASDAMVLQYLNDAGTEVWVGSVLWRRYVDGAGALQWSSNAPVAWTNATLASSSWVNQSGHAMQYRVVDGECELRGSALYTGTLTANAAANMLSGLPPAPSSTTGMFPRTPASAASASVTTAAAVNVRNDGVARVYAAESVTNPVVTIGGKYKVA